MKKQVKIRAMAKINLGLDVLRRRENGYHDVKMVMQTVNLFDSLTFLRTEGTEIKISCDRDDLPLDENNLVYQAAKMFFEKSKNKQGVHISIEKNIPIAAGMAGGSTDAAATLLALNELFEAGFERNQLAEIAVKLGADIPYCIYGGTYLSEGIGEVLTPIENTLNSYVVIAKPAFGISTKYVYDNLHVDTIKVHPDIDGLVCAIKNQDLLKMAELMENILENVTIKKYPQIQEMKKCLIESGAINALMSGSGPTVFGIFQDQKVAEQAYKDLIDTGYVEQGCVTTFINSQGSVE